MIMCQNFQTHSEKLLPSYLPTYNLLPIEKLINNFPMMSF